MNIRNSLGLLLSALTMSTIAATSGMAASPSSEEIAAARRWSTEHLGTQEAALPFSFTFDGRSSPEPLKQWEFKSEQRTLDSARTEHTMTWSDPHSGLHFRCVIVNYEDFPAVEWALYFKNEGKEQLPLLKDILALNTQFVSDAGGEFVLHGTKGDWCTPDSFQPFEKELGPGTIQRFTPVGGRPTNGAFPYYNLQSPGGDSQSVLLVPHE